MNIVIPMAGQGKRMRPHTLTTPKPLIPIAGKSIVQRLVEDIVHTTKEKIEHITFIIHPSFSKDAETMLLNIATAMGAKGHITYQEEPKGTAHAILCAAEFLEGNVLVAFADTLFDARFEIDTEKDAIIWTQRLDNPEQFGVVVLDDTGKIIRFEEKPTTFVSDLAIIGVYYFKDGKNLKQELQFLLDNNIQTKGEYQLTDAMENMRKKGKAFYTDIVNEWLDCGNKDATVKTNQRILALKSGKEELISASAKIENTTIIPPVYIGPEAVLKNAVIGPYTSIEAGCKIENAIIENSIVCAHTQVQAVVLTQSLIGKEVNLAGQKRALSLGDFCTEA